MNFKGVVLALGAASFVVFSTLASGQQMYRCGNTYQDTPCQSGGETKRIGDAVSVFLSVLQATSALHVECRPWAV